MNFFEKFINYLKETRLELRHVNWPSRQNTIRFTLLVIGASAILALYIGLLDVFFQYLLNTFIF
ncbi:preprotein translocase subunit SecE [Candidatus Giovannonibacteria bacterium RIFCSPLOWO2_02_FULL_45_14]|uniref:Protein translocase subunit SecE n=1 Tax=Candidatus Giovannonibacteria bacterium RIFCSPLOWO2_12_FULL_44_15 TaxID=1798364 RepID=A0A1F5Y117_9BACT|nr:MAG: preprotein translocase subunit SecE [Candidatus Giovannonibacteria bacterium RIFCSPHIGHO2_02_FULL_44_31]OGF76403.1 MAG: preprotein translocase subunit SecE [Candidatus Giovannonibacteria bacterium RIFCSPHIGHO2_12_FULL_44_29]OGF91075.1 MAG: preprotein translocase subunit SecE [Candidatus Giovannonibacteria bacterium RIFCSPLOWO2_02_FULL_45_14]OGF93772.1 MAG: preprotein translocase subunit SecE [Candidatus Giovannonibacteria bacterium RIFCSPLOWO2_12_FULL_44_15]